MQCVMVLGEEDGEAHLGLEFGFGFGLVGGCVKVWVKGLGSGFG